MKKVAFIGVAVVALLVTAVGAQQVNYSCETVTHVTRCKDIVVQGPPFIMYVTCDDYSYFDCVTWPVDQGCVSLEPLPASVQLANCIAYASLVDCVNEAGNGINAFRSFNDVRDCVSTPAF
jgi:hypothetical protein